MYGANGLYAERNRPKSSKRGVKLSHLHADSGSEKNKPVRPETDPLAIQKPVRSETDAVAV